mgnify:CR=1 FL=1
MNLENICLLIAGVINLFMSIFVISRGWRNKVNLYFTLLTFFNFLWASSLLVGRMTTLGMFWYYAGVLLAYPVALGIAISLYYFCISFPTQIRRLSNLNHFLIVLPAVIMSIVVYIKGWFVLSYDKDIIHTEYTLYVNKLSYFIYSLYFIVLVILALKELYEKIKISESIFKYKVIILFVAILIGLIFGTYFDLFLCYFANYHYVWFGPLFTFFMNLTVFYFIYSSRDKIHG